MKDFGLTRNLPVKLGATALLFVDVQNYSAEGGGEYAHLPREEVERRYGYFFREMRERAVPNMRRLQHACRQARVEVLYTVIESLTQDGRDMGLDYKISRLFCPRGSRDAQVIEEIAPVGDEIVIPKTSSSVFISTNIHYVLGNLGVKHLVVCGVLTDQCVDSTVRDAMFRDYLCVLLQDCMSEPIGSKLSRTNHEASLLTAEVLLGWVSDSARFLKAVLGQPVASAGDK